MSDISHILLNIEQGESKAADELLLLVYAKNVSLKKRVSQ